MLEHTIKNNGGYLSQACSAAEIIATLYTQILNMGTSESEMVPGPFGGVPGKHPAGYVTGAGYNGAKAPHLDRFFFSPAHYALVLYAALIEVGRMSPDGLLQFNKDGSTVEMIGAEHSPGMEVTAGSLAQGLSQAAGVALARKLRRETGRCVVFLSDGEFQEGQTWETFEVMNHYKLDNVLMYVDVNGQQCDGKMSDVLDLGDIAEKVRAFGAEVYRVDGHDVEALAASAQNSSKGRPVVVLADTSPYQGLPMLAERAPKFHYIRFTSPEERASYQAFLDSMGEES
ncbi:MAG: transketolase [Bacilli bacterium]